MCFVGGSSEQGILWADTSLAFSWIAVLILNVSVEIERLLQWFLLGCICSSVLELLEIDFAYYSVIWLQLLLETILLEKEAFSCLL